jgi:ABC-type glycerol-3-phosphate transport system substrate-binding protein
MGKKLCATIVLAAMLLLLTTIVGLSKEVELSYWRFGGIVEELELEPEFMKMFNKENPGIKVRYDQWSWTTRREKMLTSFLTDSMPDIFLMYEDNLPGFAKMGMITPIETLTSDAPKVVAEWTEIFRLRSLRI